LFYISASKSGFFISSIISPKEDFYATTVNARIY
jgi:hypothetical protein